MKENQGQNFDDKVRFISEHGDEIRPIASDPNIVDEITRGNIDQSVEKVDQTIEEFENKLFICEKTNFAEGAKRILITVDNPGPYNTVKGIVSELLKDERCKSIAVITGGVSSKIFVGEFGDQFDMVRDEGKPFLDDLNKVSSFDNPFDITIGTVSSNNGPESVALWSGKSILGAKKTFLLFGEWAGLGSNFDQRMKDSDEGKKAIAKIDGIFCNDKLAKRIIMQDLPEFSPDKIFDIGTPALDSLELPKAKELREVGREKLGLKPEDFTILFVGDCTNYPEYGCDPELNVQTFKKSLEAIIKLAKENPDLNFAFLLRPHPRDPEKEKLYEFAGGITLPPNLKFISASREVISMNEAAYASDVVTSIVSTENIFAPIRGNFSIFLSFKEKGFGNQMLENFYRPNVLESIRNSDGISMADSPEDFSRIILNLKNHPENRPKPKTISSKAVDGVLAKIFE